jgi:gamma-glutamylcyclotransferase (GGCT)/AIG2-like uncharacterized protein YtfP
MLYFAYGSNLDPVQMRDRCPGHQVVGLAVLQEHRIAFPVFSPDWGGGVAGPVPAHGRQVWGVLYELSDAQMAALDSYEGFKGPGDQHNFYDRGTVTVDVTRPDDGSVPRRVRAATYFPHFSKPAPPTRAYLDTILRGALHHRLPEDYVEALRSEEVAGESSPPAAGA